MAARKIPGGALAVVKNHRLIFARGYGWADRERQVPARPDTLFRIASLSKPITAVAVLKLVEQRKLSLEARAFEIVNLKPLLAPERPSDARLKQITLCHLLQHTAGWDREKSFDPMFRPREIARAQGVCCPPGPRDIIRYMLGQPLDFDPGARHAYSNFGYCVLGRVIEAVTGLTYERAVQRLVLEPIGIRWMRLGASLSGGRTEGEAHYYMPDDEQTRSVFPGTPERVPTPYGGFCIEAMDAHGGWLASAVGLARFAAALDDPDHSPLLKAQGFQTMYAPPPPPVARKEDGSVADAYYGCGWSVRRVGKSGRANYWHTGSLPGTFTLLVRRWDGLSWVALFNQRSGDKNLPDAAIDAALHRAADAVKEWKAGNLFSRW